MQHACDNTPRQCMQHARDDTETITFYEDKMIQIIRNIFSLINPAERSQAYWCFLAMLLMAIMDVIGVASIMPFMAVISDPEAVQHHTKLAWLYHKFQFTSNHSFMIFLGLFVFAML